MKTGADGIAKFTKSMGEMILLDVKKIDALAIAMAKLQEATKGPGFFSTAGDIAVGVLKRNEFIAGLMADGRGTGGVAGSGQTSYLNGAAVVHLSQQTVNTLIQGLGGKMPVSAQPATTTTAKPEPWAKVTPGPSITSASFAAMAKTDPLFFALSQLLEFERAKDKAKDGTTSKVDIQIALLDRIAEAAAKTAGSTEAHAAFQKKFNYMLK